MTRLELKQAARIEELERDNAELTEALNTTENEYDELVDEHEKVCAEYDTFMQEQLKLNLAVIDRLLADADTIKELTEKNKELELRNDYLVEDLEFMESSYDDLFDDYHDMEEFYLAIIDDNEIEIAEAEETAEFLELEIDDLLTSRDMIDATIINMMDEVKHERQRSMEMEQALVASLVNSDTLKSQIAFLSDRMRRIAQFCA